MLSPRAIVQTPTNPSSANIAISFQLIDREKEPGNIILEYSTNAGVTFNSATLVDSSETQNLQSDWYPGITHTVRWNSVTDMVGISGNASVIVKVTPSDATNPSGGTSDVSRTFVVNNIEFNQPPGVSITTPEGVQLGNIPINYSLSDVESDTCSIMVEYSTDGGENWQTATMGWAGDGLTNLFSSPSGTAHMFLWNSREDNVALTGQEDDIKVRITPSDFHTGTAAETASFSVDNSIENNPPTVEITSGPEEGSTVYTLQVTFTWSGSDTDGTVIGYYYSFDRDPPNIWTTDTSATSGVLSLGEHTFRVIAVDDRYDSSAVASRTFTVFIPPPPVANFTASPTSGMAPLTVQFTDTSTGIITSWAWDFDNDGTVDSTEQNPSYTYTDPGAYTVKLSVAGPGGSGENVKSNHITVAIITWAKSYGGGGHDYACSIQQTSDGGYIVAGYTESFVAGLSSFWVLKLNRDGTVSWQKTYGGTDWDYPTSIQQTSDGGYIVAGYSGDFWIFKLRSDGIVSWQKKYGGADRDEANSIQQTSDGGYIVAGWTRSFGANADLWVLKLNSDGTVSWEKRYGGEGWNWASSVEQTSDGGYIVAGYTYWFGVDDFWVLKLKSDGTISWQKRYSADYDDAHSIQQTSDGGYVVAGQTSSFGAGSEDFWVLKLNSDGTIAFNPASGAYVTDTNAFPTNTSASAADTTATVTDTSATVTDTNATVTDTNATIEQQAP
jgi:uncharacterized delta-60 repeat protein